MATLKAETPFRGLNTLLDPSKLEPGEATVALNVDLDTGTIKKRDGFTLVHDITGAAAVLGIHDFKRDNSSEAITLDHLFKCGDELWKSHGAMSSLSEVTMTGGSTNAFSNSTEIASFITHEDRTYMVENEAQLRVTDGAAVYNSTITQAATPTVTVSTEAGAPLVGRFTYKVTRYSHAWEIESAASAESEVATVAAGQKVTIGNLPTSIGDDDRTETFRIYRRNLDGHSEWHFLHEGVFSEGPNKVDIILDSDLHSTSIAPLSVEPTFPHKLRVIEEHNGQVFAAGDNSQLYFSNALAPFSLTDNVLVGGEAEAGKITGLVSWKGSLIVFKQNSIWTVTGSTTADFAFRRVVADIGCYAPHSIVVTENSIYFLGEDGFYIYDGTKAVLISRSIGPEIQGRNYSRDNYVVGVDDKDRRCIIWSFSSVGQAANDKILVLFYGNSVEAKGPSWANWSVSGTSSTITSLARVTLNESTADRLVFAGFANSKIGKLKSESYNDLTANVNFEWRTGKIDGGFPHRQKSWLEMIFEQVKQTDSSNLTIEYYRDAESSADSISGTTQDPSAGTIATTMPVVFTRLRERARDLTLSFKVDIAKPAEIVGFSTRVEVAGRSH